MNVRERVKRIEKALSAVIADEQFANDRDLAKYIIEDYSGEARLDRSLFADRSTRKRYIALSEAVQGVTSLEAVSKVLLPCAPVLVDMDNVLVDYEEETRRIIMSEYPDMYLQPASEAAYVENLTTNQEDRDRALEIQYRQGHFLNMPPMDGALEGWERIKELGFHPQIASAPLSGNYWCLQEKLAWIDRYFGPSAVDEAHITPDKSVHDGIALIDDKPIVKGYNKAKWQHVVFDQPYNQNSVAEYRLNGWSDPVMVKILADCALRYST